MTYQMGEVLKMLNLTYDQQRFLHRWRARGAITPSVRQPDGSGTRAEWSEFDVARIACLYDLVARFHACDLQLPVSMVGEIWDALGRGEPWQLCFDIDMALTPA